MADKMNGDWECIEWRGLYGEGWGAEIVPEAFAHPAKYSRALIRRIYQEMLERGWLAEGDTVIDPFGGVALGGLDAMLAGLNWQGCELEPRFVALGQANIDLWNRRYAAQMPHWGTARIAQGDSRKLRSALGAGDARVASPPFPDGGAGDTRAFGGIKNKKANWNEMTGPGGITDYGNAAGQLGAMPEGSADSVITSPPYASSDQDYKSGWARFHNGREPLHANDSQREAQYGVTPGQLGAMPEGVVSSPPYAGMPVEKNSRSIDRRKQWDTYRASGGGQSFDAFCKTQSTHSQGYGSTDGQLATMPAGDAAISSPPFLQTSGGVGVRANAAPGSPTGDARLMARHAAGNAAAEAYGADAGNLGNMREGVVSSPPRDSGAPPIMPERVRASSDPRQHGAAGPQYVAMATMGDSAVSSPPFENQIAQQDRTFTMPHDTTGRINVEYGETPGLAGSLTGDTFWTAARAIVAETFSVLRPGAHAAWVVKGFVRNRKLVDFPDQWRQLCESVGFVTVAEVRAWVVEDKGTQLAMDGEDKRHVTERKSFFRRLAEKKGSPRIDWETVWLMVKPPTVSTMFARPDGRES